MSKTIKPIIAGTHRYLSRSSLDDVIGCREPRVLSKADAIADSTYIAAEIDMTETPTFTTLRAMDEAFLSAYHETEHRMAAWEIALLEGVDGAAWTTSTAEQQMLSATIIEAGDDAYFADRDRYDDDEDMLGDYAGAWLEGSLDDAFPTGGYIVEGGQRDRTSGKAGGYVRVHELAKDLDVRTGDLVAFLCEIGEHVAGPLAYIAKPVADDCRSEWAAPMFYDMPRRTPAKTAQHDPHAWVLSSPALAALRRSLLG